MLDRIRRLIGGTVEPSPASSGEPITQEDLPDRSRDSISARDAFGRFKKNPWNTWNASPSTDVRSSDPRHASNRIRTGYYTPKCLPASFSISQGARVFTMGSCFARELEWALRARGFDICSMPTDLLDAAELQSTDGSPPSRFFHRYNLPSMELEFRRSVGDLPFDERRDLLVETGTGVYDLNYGNALPRGDLDLAVRRRELSRAMVANFATADLIVVTLGLAEAWWHRPSGMFCNSIAGDVAARNRDDFEFHFIGYDENLASLERLYRCLQSHHRTGDFHLLVTVSPVPLTQTFTSDDIVVANSRAKSTLRAVAGAFCDRHANATYFPSYEVAMFSDPAVVWKADTVHVLPECVKHIISTFSEQYIQSEAPVP